jgi:hypothetical protein
LRDVMFGFGGMVVGGSVGVVGVLACEALAGLVVAAWWLAAPGAPEAPAPVARMAAAEVRSTAPASAPGEVQLHTLAMARVMLDGEPMEYQPAIGAYSARVAPGEHRVQILEAFGTAVKAEATVRVQSGVRSQLRYAKGALTDQGTMPLGSARVAAAPPPAAVVVTAPVAVSEPTEVAVETVSVSAGPKGIEISGPEGGAAISIGGDGLRVQSLLPGVKLPKLLGRN